MISGRRYLSTSDLKNFLRLKLFLMAKTDSELIRIEKSQKYFSSWLLNSWEKMGFSSI